MTMLRETDAFRRARAESLSRVIRSARAEAGLSLRDLGTRMGRSASAVASIEWGKVIPSSELLFDLEKSLSLAPGTVFTLWNEQEMKRSGQPVSGTDDPRPLSLTLKARRKDLGLTQEQVAYLSGVTRSTISRWERGSVGNPSVAALLACEAALDLRPGELSVAYALQTGHLPQARIARGEDFLTEDSGLVRLHLPEPGIIGPDGRVLSNSASIEPASVVVTDVAKTLIGGLSSNPENLYKLSDREFEYLIAELLSRDGYHASLTSGGADGGVDIVAVRKDGLGKFMFLVECKRYSRGRKVGVNAVRQLHGVVAAQKATAGMIATTSFFTQSAEAFHAYVPFRLSLRNFYDLADWLQAGPS